MPFTPDAVGRFIADPAEESEPPAFVSSPEIISDEQAQHEGIAAYDAPTWADRPTIPPDIIEAVVKQLPGQGLLALHPEGREFLKTESEIASGFTSPTGVAVGAGLALMPQAALPVGIAFGGPQIYEGVKDVLSGKIGSGAAKTIAGAGMILGGAKGAKEFSKRTEAPKPPPIPTEKAVTPETVTPPSETTPSTIPNAIADRARYEELQSQIRELSTAEKIDADKLRTTWAESEQIKNKYGGMPPPPETPAQDIQLAGGPLEMRKSAERATTSPQIPEPVQERIATAPESFYETQPMKSVEEIVSQMPDSELGALSPESNIYVAGKLELSTRLLKEGKLDEGYEVFKEVSGQGTVLGQNINQFKFLKGQAPINYVHIINKGLKESGRDPLTTAQAEKVAEIADRNIESAKKLENAKREWQRNPTDENAAAADKLLQESDAASIELQREMSRYQVLNWPQMLKAFVQGNPLTPVSHVANFLGNSTGAGLESGARTSAVPIDVIRSAITGNPRELTVQPIKGTIESAKGFVRGLKQVPDILTKGAGQTIKGDVRAELRPLIALRNAFAKNPDVPTVGGKVPFSERAKLAVQGIFGMAPESMLRLLSAADKPAYLAARSRLIAEQLKLGNVPQKQWSFAQKFPELFLKPDQLKQVNLESSKAIYQEPSRAINALNSLVKQYGGDWGDLAFTIGVAPYRLTPWNLIKFTLQYNPIWAAFRSSVEAAKGNTRQAELNAGRMIVGSMLYTTGYFLYKNGLVGPSLDERDESQKSRLLSGEVIPPNHVNIDGLKRLMAGGDPKFQKGDETWDLTRGGGAAGAIITAVSNIGRDFEKQPAGTEQWLPSLLRNSTLEQASFTINQSFLKGVTSALDAIRDRNLGPYINSVENMLLNVAAPNTLSSASRATREYAPDLKADTVAKELENVVRNRFGILGADDYLSVKRDLWGKPMKQTPEGRNALLYQLFDISKGKQVTGDPVALELYDLWRKTSDAKVIPSIPSRQITVARETYPLNNEQYSRYSELVGKARRPIAEQLVKNPNWQNLSEENKATLLDRAYDIGQQVGKAQFYQEFGSQLVKKPKKTGFK